MSATGRSPRGGGEHDFFRTPTWTVHRFLDHPACPLRSFAGGLWLEPCAGDGAIIKAVHSWWHKSGFNRYYDISWVAVEIREECRPELEALPGLVMPPTIGNFLEDDGTERVFDAVLTNPPYILAPEFLVASLKRAKIVAFLLRLGFLESDTRNEFMRACPPDVFILPNRPQMDTTKKGSDATIYGWCVWDADNLERPAGNLYVLTSTPKAERKHIYTPPETEEDIDDYELPI